MPISATSPDLFRAILAMDSYNRGGTTWSAGIELTGTQIGTATIRQDTQPAGAAAASFFAQAYTWNGKTVISYRGTDQALPSWQNMSLGDFATGW